MHGFVRATKDLDIVPAPSPENLERLARVLVELGAQHVGVGEFSPEEFPYDPTDPVQLALVAVEPGVEIRLRVGFQRLVGSLEPAEKRAGTGA